MTDRPAVLIMQRHLGPITAFLQGSYDVYRFWEHPPAEAAPLVRAMVVAGEFELEKQVIETLPNLGLIACFTSGYDRIDVAWAEARGLSLSHAPGVNHEEVADFALGQMLAVRREIVAGDRALRAGLWSVGQKTLNRAMRGQKVGIVGLGAIGEALAQRCQALNMEVRWWGPREKPQSPWTRANSLIDLASWADNLVIACRVDETNVSMVSREIIHAVGPGGLIVNVARGQVIDEPGLIEALKSGALGFAALDVFTEEPTRPELWADVPNTVLTPHNAGATTDSVQRMLLLLMQNLAAYFVGEPLVTPIPGRGGATAGD